MASTDGMGETFLEFIQYKPNMEKGYTDHLQLNFPQRDCINSVHVLFIVATSTPLLKDLYEYVTPCYAAEWRVLGTLLGLTTEDLKIIQHDNHHKAVPCCNAVLEKWLEKDPFASWNKLLGVIQSDAMALATDQVAERGDYNNYYPMLYLVTYLQRLRWSLPFPIKWPW